MTICSNVCLPLQIGALVNTIVLIGVLFMLVIMDVGASTAKETHRISTSSFGSIDDDYENLNEDLDESSLELMQKNLGLGKKDSFVVLLLES